MNGQDIIIEQLREKLEKAHAASEYQTRRIEHYRTQLDFCERRAEKAERERDEERHLADVRGEMLTKTERERDEWKARHDTLADVSRKCIATAERERDARPDISAKDAAHAIKFFRGWDDKGSITEKVFSALRAHAAKAVKP